MSGSMLCSPTVAVIIMPYSEEGLCWVVVHTAVPPSEDDCDAEIGSKKLHLTPSQEPCDLSLLQKPKLKPLPIP